MNMSATQVKTKIPKAKAIAKEIKLKSRELPRAISLPDKKVKIELIDEDKTTYTAIVSAKSYRKAETEAAEFENWIAVVSGQLKITDFGCNILDAAIKVFEWQDKTLVGIKQIKTKVAKAKVVKREISLKFLVEFPRAVPMPAKKLKVELIDDDDITYTALINRKNWHKAETEAAELETWMAFVSGQLSINEQGCHILEAATKVFEQKAKPLKEEKQGE